METNLSSVVDTAHAETPGAARGVFLDSAGSSLPPRVVTDTVVDHLRREAEIGGYAAAAERADDLLGVRASVGRLLGAPARTVALSDSATRAWCDFFYAVPLAPGDRILLSPVEYATGAVAALQRARATGATVEQMPADDTGAIDVAALERVLDERVALVSLVHAPTNSGLINPVREVVDAAHAVGARVLLDACQSVGQVDLDVVDLGVDALSATGRKWLRGPRGTGMLYVAEHLLATLEPRSLDLHSATWTGPTSYEIADDARRFETWEHDVAARLGLGAAVDHLLALGPRAVEAAVRDRADRLRGALRELPRVTVRDPDTRRDRLSGIVTFTVDGVDPSAVKTRLAEQGVTVTVSPRSSTLLDMTARGLDAVVRASPHCFLRTDQLDAAVSAVSALR
ncbi:aminotransferase class V-fold PLP-dependent enzyme [Rhodococcoides corynebacterioides]|uniref:aminotransferase class V-fold PLP-dependent enzyme n=1 Tax=Rhodococcoides corynebacterioides TaxID=53972 RepID=UPI000832C576|nr:aminotransferase class V-fold PLP-dependent enzyme [Rhodococcus corynebacterioides]MBY6351342.1 aminotransferase class V-fold PLP-dependent enzyme [Rhodococcus corynebacterioides]MBY6364249.1 aminotransferase class V-fold PLP-dependent enzyme [Rhodococcus corynebacterioides]